MDLSTTYLGLRLPHPILPGSSPLSDDLDMVRRLEDAGAPAIVMRSLFEEQIVSEELATYLAHEATSDSSPEALSYMPEPPMLSLGTTEYLEQIQRIQAAVAIPVIASLNGTTPDRWLEYARLIAQAGADALELNIYDLPTDPRETGEDVERRILDLVETLREAVSLPLAVKLSPFYSSLSNLARRLELAGADGLVIFNRFYQPDFDVDTLEVVPKARLSSPTELLLRLRWLSILSSQVEMSLAVTGGVHNAVDAVKAVMAGAHAVQVVSLLLRRGPTALARLKNELARWVEEHEYDSLEQMRGSLSAGRGADTAALERVHYMRVLHSWRPDDDSELRLRRESRES
jgi:dihydroorotate dehydrogenase (fumarate)